MPDVVFCTVPTDRHAARVVRALEHAGHLDSDLSVLPNDAPKTRRKARAYATRVLACALLCAALGGALGATLGWVSSLSGQMLFSGSNAGALAGSGSLFALWIGASVGAAAGSLTGSLIGLGDPLRNAPATANAHARRSVLVSVRAVDAQQTSAVERVLERAGGILITTSDALHAPPRPAPDATAYA